MSRGPGFITDLVQDLRSRNLLIPAIGLLLAIVAVPILLGGGSGDEPTASAPAALEPPSMRGAAEVDPVVVSDVPGLRDYRKRLDGNGRNPFVQQMIADGSGAGDEGSGGSSGGSGSTDTGSTASPAATATGSSTGSTVTPPTSDTGSSSTGTTSTPGAGQPESKLLTYTIDVRVGPAGDTKVLRDVEPLALLPGKKRPVVQYVNSDGGGTRSGFVVSPQVTKAKGDGKCDPGRNDCQFLFLGEGDLEKLVYGDKQRTYRLELLSINRTLVSLHDNAD